MTASSCPLRYYWVTGRTDDVLIVSGHNIGTAEVESAFVAHPSVAEAAVVGFPHPVKGNAICAYVTLSAGAAPTTALRNELRSLVAKEIGAFARPAAGAGGAREGQWAAAANASGAWRPRPWGTRSAPRSLPHRAAHLTTGPWHAHRPEVVHWAPALPKTRSGKIMRRILRKLADPDFHKQILASGDISQLGDTSTLAAPEVVQHLIESKAEATGGAKL